VRTDRTRSCPEGDCFPTSLLSPAALLSQISALARRSSPRREGRGGGRYCKKGGEKGERFQWSSAPVQKILFLAIFASSAVLLPPTPQQVGGRGEGEKKKFRTGGGGGKEGLFGGAFQRGITRGGSGAFVLIRRAWKGEGRKKKVHQQ